MNLLKRILKDKSKPFFEKESNNAYETLFSDFGKDPEKKSDNKVFMIIKEVSNGRDLVVLATSLNGIYTEINKNGKITKFKVKNIEGRRMLNQKDKMFNTCINNFNNILSFESGKQGFLNKKGVRISLVTSNGIYYKEGQFNEFKDKVTSRIFSFFLNMAGLLNNKGTRLLLTRKNE